MTLDGYVVQRTLNNNVVVVNTADGFEEILVGKGLGFGVRPGTELTVDDPRIEKRFRLVQEENRRKFQQLYTVVQPEVIGVAEEIIARTAEELGVALHEHIHVALPDHIGFALTRLQGGLEIENPFLEEIRTLYPTAWKHAKAGAELIEKRFGIPIPDSEVGFLTLHIHAATHPRGLSETIRTAHAVKSAVAELERLTGTQIERDTIDYARFVTHLRFALQRLTRGEPIVNPLASAIRERLPTYYEYAEAVAKVVEEQIGVRFPEDEIAYLAMHLARMVRGELADNNGSGQLT
jgi:transcriptional antiterminator